MAPGCMSNIRSLLYWSMLAACTVGPGTVVTCARSGVEYQFSLAWSLCFATILAYSLQEGSARLTLVSGKTMGQCLQDKFKTSAGGAPIACWLFTIAVYIGNTLYQCNNFAGGIEALLAFPGMQNVSKDVVRIVGCLAYAAAELTILYMDQVDAIGVGLGVVMMAMIVLFLGAAASVGFSGPELLWGFLPNIPETSSLPAAAAPVDTIVSLIGTTAVGINVFLGGAMAVGKTLSECRRGIAFSAVSSLIVSLLIMIVGTGSEQVADLRKFSISILADTIQKYFGNLGTFAFALGFVAAALSSMLTGVIGVVMATEALVIPPVKDEEGGAYPKLPRKAYWSIAFSMVLIGMSAVLVNLPRAGIILVANLFNGVLLPGYSLALLLCITDPEFMGSSHPSRCSLLTLVGSVTVTLILSWRVILEKSALVLSAILGIDLSKEREVLLIVSGVLGAISMLLAWAFARRRQAFCHQHSDEGSSVTGTVSATSIGNATESDEGEARRLKSDKRDGSHRLRTSDNLEVPTWSSMF